MEKLFFYFCWNKSICFFKKSHTLEEGGAHLRISVLYLLMNLKNNCLWKNLLMWANKKRKKLNIFNVVFFKENKRKTPGGIIILRLCTKSLDDMIYSSWYIECESLKLIIVGLFFPFLLIATDVIFLSFWTMLHPFTPAFKIIWHEIQSFFCNFGSFFALWPSLQPKNQTFEKMEKASGYVIILHICFVIYGMQQT